MSDYRISEIFFSAQGEGSRAGMPSLFIRMSGCSLRCEYCDTKDSWSGGGLFSKDEILSSVKDFFEKYPGTEQIVITGGEPLEQDLKELIDSLRGDGYFVAMETNGMHIPDTEVDWLTVSPKDKSGYIISEELAKKTDEMKLIVNENLDVETIQRLRSISKDCPIFLQPQNFDDNRYRNTYDLFKECISKGIENIRLGFQIHKIYGID